VGAVARSERLWHLTQAAEHTVDQAAELGLPSHTLACLIVALAERSDGAAGKSCNPLYGRLITQVGRPAAVEVELPVGSRDFGDAIGKQANAVRLAPPLERQARFLQEALGAFAVASVGGLKTFGDKLFAPRKRRGQGPVRKHSDREPAAVARPALVQAFDLGRTKLDILRAQIGSSDAPMRLKSFEEGIQIGRQAARGGLQANQALQAKDKDEPDKHGSPLAGGGTASIYICDIVNIRSRPMLSRRLFLAASAAGGLALWRPQAVHAEAVLGDDGLYRQPWFLESFLELADDLAAASEKKKRFAIIWELRGCPYCKETHLVNFAKPEIENFIKERFEVLQLNIVGAREVTDFDGEKLPEKRLAAKYGVRFTPTFQFFPENVQGLAAKKPREREVARAQGYMQPQHFLALFRFVAERAYEKGSLRDYLKANG
jgi:thioredoxin-related protein